MPTAEWTSIPQQRQLDHCTHGHRPHQRLYLLLPHPGDGPGRRWTRFTDRECEAAARGHECGRHVEPRARRHVSRRREDRGHRHLQRGDDRHRRPLPAAQRRRLRAARPTTPAGAAARRSSLHTPSQPLTGITDGISIPGNPVIRVSASSDNSVATIRSAAGIDAALSHSGLSDHASHKVDGSTAPPAAAGGTGAPTVTGMSITSTPARSRTYGANEEIVVVVSWSARVYGFDDPEPTLNLTIGSSTVEADFVHNMWDKTTFSYKVRSGDVDANGVSIPENPINMSSNSFIRRNGGDQDAVLTYAGLDRPVRPQGERRHGHRGPHDHRTAHVQRRRPLQGVGDVIAVRVSF